MKKALAFLLVLASLLAFSPIDEAYAKKQSCNAALGGCNKECENMYSSFNPGRLGCYAGCSIGWAFC
jgi:hypothetical protein